MYDFLKQLNGFGFDDCEKNIERVANITGRLAFNISREFVSNVNIIIMCNNQHKMVLNYEILYRLPLFYFVMRDPW